MKKFYNPGARLESDSVNKPLKANLKLFFTKYHYYCFYEVPLLFTTLQKYMIRAKLI